MKTDRRANDLLRKTPVILHNQPLQRTPRERFARKQVGIYIASTTQLPAAPLSSEPLGRTTCKITVFHQQG